MRQMKDNAFAECKCDMLYCTCKPTDLSISASGFKKFDGAKAQWHLMPEAALEQVLKVLEHGAAKYGDYNWIDNAAEVQWTRYQNALERHLKAFKQGQDMDKDSGLYELAHLACNALMLLQYQIENKGIDNRRKKETK